MLTMSRRNLLPSLMSLFGLRHALRARPASAEESAFPADFVWGVSTSSYQIEGAVDEDGRGKSIWDVYSHTPGRVQGGDTGDVACDHYHRWREDVELVARGGFNAYRFSTAWPRIQPVGTGVVEQCGLDFYDRLVDALIARGVTPWLCLYHWDLPQALQDEGGWLKRDIAPKFADYARIVARRLGDRVKHWAMFNEANVHAMLGYGTGVHAPGLTGLSNMLAATHHQNLAQGRALQALRAEHSGLRLGTVISLQPVRPCSEATPDRRAAERFDAFWNGAFLDPLLTGSYPAAIADEFAPLIAAGDLATTHQPIDFLGVNYYSRMHIADAPGSLFGASWGAAPAGTRFTAMGWPINPEGLYEELVNLRARYGDLELYVTENGACFDDRRARRRRARRRARGVLPRAPRRRAPRARRRRAAARLFRLVAARQLRMGRRLRPALRHCAR
jgi:beta-glucosidase